jgi:GAF domain-containing protein
MPQSARQIANDQITHHRLAKLLARQEQRSVAAVGAAARWRDRISLAAIAKAMNVPVVLATFRDENGMQTYATYGLGLMNNLAHFAATCDALCGERVVVIPDTRTDPALSKLSRHWPAEGICFLVGVPLRNADGHRVGSLAVMNNSRAVAQSGISFRTLADVGQAFAQTGRLHCGFADV